MDHAIFIYQSKYTKNILNRFKIENNKPSPTPIAMGLKLKKKDWSKNVTSTMYMSMVGSLMYLRAKKVDIMYAMRWI